MDRIYRIKKILRWEMRDKNPETGDWREDEKEETVISNQKSVFRSGELDEINEIYRIVGLGS